MIARNLALASGIALLALTVSSCGGSDSSSSSSLSAESEAAIEQIETICDDAASEAREARGDFPVADFDPEHPDPAGLPAVGNYFSIGHAIWDKALVDARAVTVHAEIQPQVDALLSAVESDLALAKSQAAAAKASDVDGFVATLPKVDESAAVVDEAADELGADCAY